MKSIVISCLLLCLTLLLSTCSDDDRDNTCSVDDPVRDLAWLKTVVDTYQASLLMDVTIEQGTYRFQTVFIINLCCPTCYIVPPRYIVPPPVFTCEGVAIDMLSPDDEHIKNKKVIWETSDDHVECW